MYNPSQFMRAWHSSSLASSGEGGCRVPMKSGFLEHCLDVNKTTWAPNQSHPPAHISAKIICFWIFNSNNEHQVTATDQLRLFVMADCVFLVILFPTTVQLSYNCPWVMTTQDHWKSIPLDVVLFSSPCVWGVFLNFNPSPVYKI